MRTPLKTSTAWAHIKAIDQAIEIVNSWPEWKREPVVFPPITLEDSPGQEVRNG